MPARKNKQVIEIQETDANLCLPVKEDRHSEDIDVSSLSKADITNLIEELQAHQIALEVQNEELRESQMSLQVARDRYRKLYNIAPAGYLTLQERNIIEEANLTACTLLNIDKKALLGTRVTTWIERKSHNKFYQLRRRVYHSLAPPNPANW